MLPALTETVTVIRPTWIRQRGDKIADWDTATEHDLPGCLIRPSQGTETLVNGRRRNTVTTRWALSAPLDADLNARDRIRRGSEIYEVDGEPQRVQAQSPHLNHIEAQLYKVEG